MTNTTVLLVCKVPDIDVYHFSNYACGCQATIFHFFLWPLFGREELAVFQYNLLKTQTLPLSNII